MKRLGFEFEFEAMATGFSLVGRPEFIPIDLLWVSPETFGKMAGTPERAGRHGEIPVIDFETLLAMKLHAVKDNSERHGKDLLDIREILGKNPDVISEERLREICEKFAGPGGYELVRNNK